MTFVTSKARVFTDSSGAWTDEPVLLTPDGPLNPLLDYCVSKHDRSLSWKKKLNYAAGLFLDYVEANPDEPEHWRLFRNFAIRLYTGTFDRETGLDPSGLCWRALPWDTANYIPVQLSEFFDWLGKTNQAASKLNPKYAGGLFDRRMDEFAYLYRRQKAFLGHTWATNPTKEESSRLTRPKRMPIAAPKRPPAFPEGRFEELLFKGFKVGGQYDYRNMLITLLMHGAGFRVSEPFHLYVSDVWRHPLDSTTALVHIYHPTLGRAPDGWRNNKGKPGTRQDYLSQRWAMAPRTELLGRTGAGWKNCFLDDDQDYFMRANWFLPVYGKWFLEIWQEYMKQVAQIDRNHPYAFINLNREPIGDMYKLDSFAKAHRAAVLRIGLEYGKSFGTTDHGHRHAFAQALKRADVDPVFIQECLHHCSIESQEQYTRSTMEETRSALAEAAERIRSRRDDVHLAETMCLSS